MRRAVTLLMLLLVGLVVISCTNDPFDPLSVANTAPTARFYVAAYEDGGELNPTSYYERQFYWSGTDPDGTVEEYHISIRTDADVPAPWTVTTRTDTFMSFLTDDEGRAEATVYLACRDDRGAMSDTLVQYIPLRNFPPALNFQSDFEPLVNMQRDIIMEGEVPVDTVYWNWGVMNARCFAFDLDGTATMDSFYRYTLSETEPTEVVAWDDPSADPMVHWIRHDFGGINEIKEFEILLDDVPAGQRTLTVAVADEAHTETRLLLRWEVRDPSGSMLVVPDNSSYITQGFYDGILDEVMGEGTYDTYDFWFGFPDSPGVLLATLRKFDVVFWYDGGGTSEVLQRAAATDGVLQQYLYPLDDSQPGRLLMISRNLTGNLSGLPNPFRRNVFGISPSSEPAPELAPKSPAVGLQALGVEPHLPPMAIQSIFGRGRGMQMAYGLEDAYDELYRFDAVSHPRYWTSMPNGVTWEPLIGVRRPQRVQQELASAVGFSYELHTMQRAGVLNALEAVLTFELGVLEP